MFLACAAAIAACAACSKTPQEQSGDNSKDPSKDDPSGEVVNPSDEPEVPKSNQCKLTSFVVTAGEFEIDGFVDPTDNTIEISFMPNEYEFLKAATAVVEISDKATITPDPAQPIDYTAVGGVKFTVTAEDGKTSSEYLVYLAGAEFSESVSRVWIKTFGEMKLAAKPNFDCGLAFVDREHFAYCDLNVFDLSGNSVGKLNVEGVTGLQVFSDSEVKANGQLAAMTNDENGVLVAIACHTGEYAEGGTGCRTEVYAWVNGWDKAPIKIYGPVDYQCMYMSVAGDVKGDFILNFRTGANSPQMHHVLVYKGGKYFNEDGSPACTWYGPMIQHPGNDGCWGQMLSFFSGNPEDGFVCWDSVGAAEMGDTGNASAAYYVYGGLTDFLDGYDDETALRGNVNWTNWDADGRWYGYGNYSIGHVRAFMYNGSKYVVASSSSWPCTWITIQKADPEEIVLDDEETEDIDESLANYLLTTDIIEGAAACAPCSAFVYDPSTGTGHVVYAAQSNSVVAYDITTERL